MDKLKIRLEEAIRIYTDSPQVQATYVDLVRIYEDLLEIIDKLQPKIPLGFNGDGKQER